MFNDAKQIIFMTYMQFVIKESVFTIKLKKNQTFHAFSDAKPDIIYKKNWGNILKKKKKQRHWSVYLHSTEGVLVFALLTEINSVSKDWLVANLSQLCQGNNLHRKIYDKGTQ